MKKNSKEAKVESITHEFKWKKQLYKMVSDKKFSSD